MRRNLQPSRAHVRSQRDRVSRCDSRHKLPSLSSAALADCLCRERCGSPYTSSDLLEHGGVRAMRTVPEQSNGTGSTRVVEADARGSLSANDYLLRFEVHGKTVLAQAALQPCPGLPLLRLNARSGTIGRQLRAACVPTCQIGTDRDSSHDS